MQSRPSPLEMVRGGALYCRPWGDRFGDQSVYRILFPALLGILGLLYSFIIFGY